MAVPRFDPWQCRSKEGAPALGLQDLPSWRCRCWPRGRFRIHVSRPRFTSSLAPHVNQIWLVVGQILPRFDQIWAGFAHTPADSAECHPVTAELDPDWTNVWRFRPQLTHCSPSHMTDLDQVWAISAPFVPSLAKFGPGRTKLGRFWPNLSGFRPNLAGFGPTLTATRPPDAHGIAHVITAVDWIAAAHWNAAACVIAAAHEMPQPTGSAWGQSVVWLGSTWGLSGSIWSSSGVDLGSICSRSRVQLGSIWDTLRLMGQSAVVLGSIWARSGVNLGSISGVDM